MTPKQIELARHALGLDGQRQHSYRNHFVVSPGQDDYAEWMQMVEAGEARRVKGSQLTGGDDCFCFWLTLQGANQALRTGESLDAKDFPPAKGW